MAPEGRRGTSTLRLLAAPVSGVLLAAAFPALDLGPLALVALVPLLLATETVRPARAAALGYLAGLTFFGLHLLWIAQFLSWTGAVAWLAWGRSAPSRPPPSPPSSPWSRRPGCWGRGGCWSCPPPGRCWSWSAPTTPSAGSRGGCSPSPSTTPARCCPWPGWWAGSAWPR